MQNNLDIRPTHLALESRPGNTVSADIDPEDLARWSAFRAVQMAGGFIKGDTPERRIHDAYVRARSPLSMQPPGDFHIPSEPLLRARAIDTSLTGSNGGNLDFTQPRPEVDALRPRSVTIGMGATDLHNFQFPGAIPLQGTAPGVLWPGDNPGTDAAESDATFAQVALTPHPMVVSTAYTRAELALTQGATPIDKIIDQDLGARVGTGLDAAALAGPGGSDQPEGIINNADVNVVAMGTNGAVPTYDALTALEEGASAANADTGRRGFVSTPQIRRVLRKTPVATGSGIMTWTGDQALGQLALVSTNVPSTLSKGTTSGACHAIIYGGRWESCVIALSPMSITVDPFTKAGQGLVEVTLFALAAIGIRHPAAFSVIVDATLS